MLGDGEGHDWSGAQPWQELWDQIHREADPALRNIRITGMYYALGRSMDAVLGAQDANWLTFGTWASHTAGRFIRGERLPVRWGAGHVADGNLAIIDDIAPCFVAYLASVADEDEGHPLVQAGRQRIDSSAYLTEAFDCYEQARCCVSEIDDPLRAQLILRANIAVAYHEQWLADRFVDQAMPLGGLFGIATTRFVELELPDLTLDLCEPVPAPQYLDGELWPPVLDQIQDPGLVGLYQRIGQAPDDVSTSAARTWEDFNERMGYIAVFFRAFQRDPALHRRPPLPMVSG